MGELPPNNDRKNKSVSDVDILLICSSADNHEDPRNRGSLLLVISDYTQLQYTLE